MMKRIAEASPPPRARFTGVVYLLYFLIAPFAEFLASRGLIAYSNAANLVAFACYILVTLLFYELFKPVNRNLSLSAAFLSLVGCGIGVLGLFHLAPSQINPLLFFGPYCILIGYLIFKSTFLPRALGVLIAFAGFGWLVFLSPLPNYLATSIEVLGVLAEGSLMLWLLVKGVNVQRWNEQSGMATGSRS
jgi:hypothetical protein